MEFYKKRKAKKSGDIYPRYISCGLTLRIRRESMKFKTVILAAGKGTRMESDLPKVLHKVCDKSMIRHVIDNAKEAGATDICVIVGYKGELVREEIKDLDVTIVEQKEQLGTGHAVKCAADFIGNDGDTLILCGDTPLIKAETLKSLYEIHKKEENGVTVLSALLDDPKGYGRIIRDAAGDFMKITEDKDCTDEERKTKEINSGMYVFDSADLSRSLSLLKNDNVQGEYYLTDTIYIIKDAGKRVNATAVNDTDEILGVNTKLQLKEAEEIMKRR